MIFVTIGTQKQQFTRLLEMLENSTELKNDEIVVQAGYTKYDSDRLRVLDFITFEKMEEYIDESEFVICHGGVGSIFTALKRNKKVLVVPRLSKYKEHINDHQLEICEQLEKDGFILYLKDEKNFDKMIRRIRRRKNKEYKSDKSFLDKLRKEI
ncbi:MAG: PssE/Cps14G family polysaccharide biosynthesis glycosyltransferase [Clostridia bacterium]|nr:PssE/Cps14G family polysaccharide biosynthesis glycosyltransferase [Clostridia bacterium]